MTFPGRVTVVVNPERQDMVADLVEALEDAGIQADLRTPESASTLGPVVEDAVADGSDVIAPVGGDGTQRTVAAYLRGLETMLAVVPGGTVNLLGQILGITTAADTVRAITGGQVAQLDLGLADGKPFVLNASTGYDAGVIEQVDDDAKRLGRLAFFKAGLSRLREDRPCPVTVTVDGTVSFSGRAMSVVVANVGQRASSDFHLAPDADPSDGRLDVIIQRCDTGPTIARTLLALLRGVRPRTDDILYDQGAVIEIAWSVPRPAQVDGDAIEHGRRFLYEVEPATLRACRLSDSAG